MCGGFFGCFRSFFLNWLYDCREAKVEIKDAKSAKSAKESKEVKVEVKEPEKASGKKKGKR